MLYRKILLGIMSTNDIILLFHIFKLLMVTYGKKARSDISREIIAYMIKFKISNDKFSQVKFFLSVFVLLLNFTSEESSAYHKEKGNRTS